MWRTLAVGFAVARTSVSGTVTFDHRPSLPTSANGWLSTWLHVRRMHIAVGGQIPERVVGPSPTTWPKSGMTSLVLSRRSGTALVLACSRTTPPS